MTKKELATEISKISRLSGHFLLRSGDTSEVFYDKYLFGSNPYLLSEIVYYLKEIIPDDAQVLAGLEMGGISLATALSLKTGINMAFIRKKAKEFGTCKRIEGPSVEGKRVCIVDDVVITGRQVLESAHELRKAGANVSHAVCVLARNDDTFLQLKKEGIRLASLYLMETITNS